MGLTFTLLAVGLFALSAVALTRAKRELIHQHILSTTSGVLAWITYLWLTALVALFAYYALWTLNIVPSVLTVLGGIVALLGLLLFALAVRQFRSLARMSGQRGGRTHHRRRLPLQPQPAECRLAFVSRRGRLARSVGGSAPADASFLAHLARLLSHCRRASPDARVWRAL